MRITPQLLLFALLLVLAPARFASADCGPGSPPDCSCIILTAPLEIPFEGVSPLNQPLPATSGNLTLSGGLVLYAANNYPGLSTIPPRLFPPSTPVNVVDPASFNPGSYYPWTYIAPDPVSIPTATILAPTATLPFTIPTASSPPDSSGVLIVNVPTGSIPAWNSELTFLSTTPAPPIITFNGELFTLQTSSYSSELSVPEPTTLALFTLGLIVPWAVRRPRISR